MLQKVNLIRKTSTILLPFVAAVLVGCVTGESFATAKKDKAVCLDHSEACKLLNRWHRQGKIAGNIGDWYDNRDGGHSPLRVKKYPQLSVVTYTEDEKAGVNQHRCSNQAATNLSAR